MGEELICKRRVGAGAGTSGGSANAADPRREQELERVEEVKVRSRMLLILEASENEKLWNVWKF